MENKYFKEIQSLRGISVILVFLFHINQNIFSFGYLGVDIFFVISGFVISRIVFESLNRKNFSINKFYASRFLRLYPALFVMIFMVIFSILLTYTLHDNPNILINTGITSFFGLSNFYLIFIENDYFNSFDENIFEHMWSLSIEFQFYIFFPIINIILFKIFKEKINIYINFFIIIIILYIFINLYSQISFFYNTHSRIGEILIGSLTFYLLKAKKKIIYILLIDLIFFFAFIFSNNIFYLILAVCFLTSIIILQIGRLNLLNKFLNIRLLQIIGNASYSIYLWHLPIIFFSKLIFSGIDYYFFSILISILISTISFKFIEQPFRYSHNFKTFLIKEVLTLKKIYLAGLLFIGTFILIDYTNSRNKIFDKLNLFYKLISTKIEVTDISQNQIDEIENKYLTTITDCHENYDTNKINNCYSSKNSHKIIYFFGDSSMLNYYLTYKNLNLNTDKTFYSYNNSSFFKPIFKGLEKGDYPTQKLISDINEFSEDYDEIILILSFNHKFNYEKIVKLKNYFLDEEKSYLNFSSFLPKKVRIIFIKDTPYFKYTLRNCEALKKYSKELISNNINHNVCDIEKKNIQKKMKRTNQMFSNLDKRQISYINLDDYFCENKYCYFFKKTGDKFFAKKFDGHHFNVETSEDIKEFFYSKILNKFKHSQ